MSLQTQKGNRKEGGLQGMDSVILVIRYAIAILRVSAFPVLLLTMTVFLGWNWIIPDLYNEVIQQHTLPVNISIWQALKLGILLFVLRIALKDFPDYIVMRLNGEVD